MSYRQNARPAFQVGDRVRIVIPFWTRVRLRLALRPPYGILCWHGYEGEVTVLRPAAPRNPNTWGAKLRRWFGLGVAGLWLPDGGSVTIPLSLLERVR